MLAIVVGVPHPHVKHAVDRKHAARFLAGRAIPELFGGRRRYVFTDESRCRTADPGKAETQFQRSRRVKANAIAKRRVEIIVIGPRYRPVVATRCSACNRIRRRPLQPCNDRTHRVDAWLVEQRIYVNRGRDARCIAVAISCGHKQAVSAAGEGVTVPVRLIGRREQVRYFHAVDGKTDGADSCIVARIGRQFHRSGHGGTVCRRNQCQGGRHRQWSQRHDQVYGRAGRHLCASNRILGDDIAGRDDRVILRRDGSDHEVRRYDRGFSRGLRRTDNVRHDNRRRRQTQRNHQFHGCAGGLAAVDAGIDALARCQAKTVTRLRTIGPALHDARDVHTQHAAKVGRRHRHRQNRGTKRRLVIVSDRGFRPGLVNQLNIDVTICPERTEPEPEARRRNRRTRQRRKIKLHQAGLGTETVHLHLRTATNHPRRLRTVNRVVRNRDERLFRARLRIHRNGHIVGRTQRPVVRRQPQYIRTRTTKADIRHRRSSIDKRGRKRRYHRRPRRRQAATRQAVVYRRTAQPKRVRRQRDRRIGTRGNHGRLVVCRCVVEGDGHRRGPLITCRVPANGSEDVVRISEGRGVPEH